MKYREKIKVLIKKISKRYKYIRHTGPDDSIADVSIDYLHKLC